MLLLNLLRLYIFIICVNGYESREATCNKVKGLFHSCYETIDYYEVDIESDSARCGKVTTFNTERTTNITINYLINQCDRIWKTKDNSTTEIRISDIDYLRKSKWVMVCLRNDKCHDLAHEQGSNHNNLIQQRKSDLVSVSEAYQLNKYTNKSKAGKCLDHYKRSYLPSDGVGCITIEHGLHLEPVIEVIITVADFLEVFKEFDSADTIVMSKIYNQLRSDVPDDATCFFFAVPGYTLVQCISPPGSALNIKQDTSFCPITDTFNFTFSDTKLITKEDFPYITATLKDKEFYFDKKCYIDAKFSVSPGPSRTRQIQLYYKFQKNFHDQFTDLSNVFENIDFSVITPEILIEGLKGIYRSTCPWNFFPPLYTLHLAFDSKQFYNLLINFIIRIVNMKPFNDCSNELLEEEETNGCYIYGERNNIVNEYTQYWATQVIFDKILARVINNGSDECSLVYLEGIEKDYNFNTCIDDNIVPDFFRNNRVAVICQKPGWFSDFYSCYGNGTDISARCTTPMIVNKTAPCYISDSNHTKSIVFDTYVLCIVIRAELEDGTLQKAVFDHIDGKWSKELIIDPRKCMKYGEYDASKCVSQPVGNVTAHVCCCITSETVPCNTEEMINRYYEDQHDEFNRKWCSFDHTTSKTVVRTCNEFNIALSSSLRCFAEYYLNLVKDSKDELYIPELRKEACYSRLTANDNSDNIAFVEKKWHPLCDGESMHNTLKLPDGKLLDDCFSALIENKESKETKLIICCKPAQFLERKLLIEKDGFFTVKSIT